MKARSPWLRKIGNGWRHAFALDSPHGPLTDDDHALLARLAEAVVCRGMGTPALLALQSVRPLNTLGSQAMTFLRPFLSTIFKGDDYDRMTAILERREGIGGLIEAVEAADTRRAAAK